MKKLFTMLFVAVSAMVANAQAPAVTITPAGATGATPVTITLNLANVCTNPTQITGTVVKMHSGIGLEADINGPNGKWTQVVAFDASGANGASTSLAAVPNQAGRYSITFTPNAFYGVTAPAQIHRLCMVFNGGAWINGEAKAPNPADPAGCLDFFIPLVTIGMQEYGNKFNANAYPNPTSDAVSIAYDVTEAKEVTVKVYDMMGQEVKTLATGTQTAGTQIIRWAGDNQNGVRLPAGNYFYRISIGNETMTRQISLR